jgi:hypothetical protein
MLRWCNIVGNTLGLLKHSYSLCFQNFLTYFDVSDLQYQVRLAVSSLINMFSYLVAVAYLKISVIMQV